MPPDVYLSMRLFTIELADDDDLSSLSTNVVDWGEFGALPPSTRAWLLSILSGSCGTGKDKWRNCLEEGGRFGIERGSRLVASSNEANPVEIDEVGSRRLPLCTAEAPPSIAEEATGSVPVGFGGFSIAVNWSKRLASIGTCR